MIWFSNDCNEKLSKTFLKNINILCFILQIYIPDDDIGLNCIKVPTKEEIFGKINEITAQYQDENEKMIKQMSDHKVGAISNF